MAPTIPSAERQRLLRVATDLCYCSDRLQRKRARDGEPPNESPAELHDAEQSALEPLIEDGFDLLGAGTARCVLRFPTDSALSDHVVKLARFGHDPISVGVVQNKREVLLWKRHGVSGDWPLLPVVDHNAGRFRWLVMPYGEPVTGRPETERRQLLRDVRAQMALLGEFDVREVRAENVVTVDGTPRLADYGRPDGT